ncbi:hypothetical protein ITJ64_04520 [Herbiconiux sp. VKM Ac-1786]|uniref:hypothetical protein n=1 Tax=Herbiconiux sp. VKM Ac-1786 TaxID=2783824 RepID=UPI00188A33BB|nr:hypothetical protein [Herbiconiux sp. VKM Ac-1786]MBF4571772.1 hypothetical protein [Herbiconiux sp. VKM Ac-1786]
MALPRTPVDRRTVLAGAAWSVPVIAVALGAPAAAASTTIDVDFAFVLLQLKRSDTVAGVIAITSTGTDAVPDQDVSVTITGLDSPTDGTYLTEFGPVLSGDGLVDKGDGTRVPTVNSAFVAVADPVGGTLTLTADRFTIPSGVVYLAVFFTWPATNRYVDGLVLAGSFTITPPSGPALTGTLNQVTLLAPA